MIFKNKKIVMAKNEINSLYATENIVGLYILFIIAKMVSEI